MQDALLQQLKQMVEPLLGFSTTAFEDTTTITERIPVSVHQRYTVLLHIAARSGTGTLPEGTVDVGSVSGAHSQARQDLVDAQKALPDHLRRWLAAQADSPTTELKSGDCLWYYEPVGHYCLCADCRGNGHFVCPTCDGKRQVVCYRCRGTPKTPCLSCNAGRRICTECHGSGGKWESRTRTVSNGMTHGDQESWTETNTEWVICIPCSGAGTRICPDCGGSAVLVCRVCEGAGSLNCTTCKAEGKLPCRTCDETGGRYECFDVQATVWQELGFVATTSRAEPKRLLESLSSLREFCRLTQAVSPGDRAVHETSIERSFSGQVEVGLLSFRAAGTAFEIVGYGTPPQIFDYKHLVSRLLQAQLEELETALRSNPLLLSLTGARLNRALVMFLASPANRYLGTRNPDVLEGPAGHDLHHAVSADYIARARAAIQGGVRRVFYRSLVPIMVLLLFFPTTILVTAHLSRWITFGPFPALIVGLVDLGLALVWERLAVWRLQRQLAMTPENFVSGVLNESGDLGRGEKWLRRIAIGGAFLGWLGGAAILTPLFPANRHPLPLRKLRSQPVGRIVSKSHKPGKETRTGAKRNGTRPVRRAGARRVGHPRTD